MKNIIMNPVWILLVLIMGLLINHCGEQSQRYEHHPSSRTPYIQIENKQDIIKHLQTELGSNIKLWLVKRNSKTQTKVNQLHNDAKDLYNSEKLALALVYKPSTIEYESQVLFKLCHPGFHILIKIQKKVQQNSALSFNRYKGCVINVPANKLRNSNNIIYVTYEKDRYLSFILNGELIDFIPVKGTMASDAFMLGFEETIFTLGEAFRLSDSISEFILTSVVPTFEQRFLLQRYFEDTFDSNYPVYPVHQYYNMIIMNRKWVVRDPSEILRINGRYYVYFTGVPYPIRDGFTGQVYCASCKVTDDPADPKNWSLPKKILSKGQPIKDHDGTGCFTPDCFYDGSKIFVFYTGINSTHPRGFPQWGEAKEPEHIMVASSDKPDRDFVKTPKYTPLTMDSRALKYDEATVPGGHETLNGNLLYDVSLIDHGQCWVMDDGERRYYYKGGGGNPDLFENLDRKHGAVCLIRNLDEDWLNGYRQNNMPIILEDSHMEGILITRVQDRLFMQLTLFGPPRKWVTYTSDSQDGIHWKLIGGAHRPKKNENYPMSIGVYPTVNPKWGMGQFPTEDGYIGLGYIKIL